MSPFGNKKPNAPMLSPTQKHKAKKTAALWPKEI